jgi:hypothetical protein
MTGNAYNILVGRRKRKRPLGRYRHKWRDGSTIDGKEFMRMWGVFSWFSV